MSTGDRPCDSNYLAGCLASLISERQADAGCEAGDDRGRRFVVEEGGVGGLVGEVGNRYGEPGPVGGVEKHG